MASKQNEALQDHTASAWGSVTFSLDTDFGRNARALWVGAAGNVQVRMLDGTTPTFVAVPAGTLLPLQCDRVVSAGTTVASPTTNIIPIY